MAFVRRTVAVAGSVVVGLVGVPALDGVASAVPIECGSIITQDTVLTEDVGPCAGDGLVIVANNVTLDLAGYQVFGTDDQGNSAGILLQNVRGVRVTLGTVREFDAGIVVARGRNNTIQYMTVHDNHSEQFVAESPEQALLGDGIVVVSSSYNRINRNLVRDNGPFSGITVLTETDGDGVSGPLPTGNLISNNVVTHNAVPDVCPSSGEFFGGPCTPGEAVFNENVGIRVEGPGATFTTIARNTVTASGRDGVSVLNTVFGDTPPGDFSPPNTDTSITANNVSGNGVAVVITDPEVGQLGGDGIFNRCYPGSLPQGCPTRTTIRGNTVNDNPAHGINLGPTDNNTVIGNTALRNGFGTMTSYASDPPYTDGFDENFRQPCDNNTWLDNRFGTVNQPCVLGHSAGDGVSSAVIPAGSEGGYPGPVPLRTSGRASI
ncbi:hypothetical protein BH18ACT4_BH18ACT4_05060 [soil metagenome]